MSFGGKGGFTFGTPNTTTTTSGAGKCAYLTRFHSPRYIFNDK